MRLVDTGALALDDPVSPIVDKLLMRLNGTRLADKFGPAANDLTIRHLLHMTSGLPDYDTSWVKGDPWRSQQFAHPNHDYGPIEILSKIDGTMSYKPGTRQDYCRRSGPAEDGIGAPSLHH